MNKTQPIIFAIVLVVTIGGIGGYFWYSLSGRGLEQRQSQQVQQVQGSSTTRQASAGGSSIGPDSVPLQFDQQGSNIPINGLSGGQASGTNGNSGNDILMGNSGSGSQQKQASTRLPGPDGFEVYEEYKSNETVLYAETKAGTGTMAEPGRQVVVSYKGWLTNGTLFDQSPDTKPFSFTLGIGQVIQGWEQGIAGMKEGGKRRLIVPPAVGYGPKGQDRIPANAVMVFDIELLAVP